MTTDSLINGVQPAALPWARTVESRLAEAGKALGNLGYSISSIPDADKTVYSEFNLGQNIVLSTLGRVEPTIATAVQYQSSTGLFEVTVSLAGLVRDGAILGASFESAENPYEIYFGIPKYGVVQSCVPGTTTWKPFSASYTTVFSSRPGTQQLALYFYADCTAGANSAAFVSRARISVKAV